MTSFIDPSVPIFGAPTTESVRHNFLVAKQEIEALQGAVGLTIPVSISHGGTGATIAQDALRNIGGLPLTGGTLTGPLILALNPTNNLGAATKQYVDAFFPVSILNGGTGANNPNQALSNLGAAPIASPGFIGTPTAPTVPVSNSSTILATTEFVHQALNQLGVAGGSVISIAAGVGIVGGGQGAVSIALQVPVSVGNGGTGATNPSAGLSNLGGAPIVSPQLLGVPLAPNPPTADDTNKIATTGWVNDAITDAIGAIGSGVISVTAGNGLTGGGVGAVTISLVSPVPIADGGTGATDSNTARNNLGAAAVNSPNLIGVPTAPSAAPTTNTSQIATTAFVQEAIEVALGVEGGPISGIIAGEGLVGGGTSGTLTIALSIPVSVADGGTGGTTPQAALFNLGGAPLNSPAFTGTPTSSVPPVNDNSIRVATTSFVSAAIAAASAVASKAAISPAPPVSPAPTSGSLWWDTISGQLFVLYDDGDSLQWVIANNLSAHLPAVSALVNVSDTPPVNPLDSSLWWNSVDLQLYVRYNDGTSTQWTPAVNVPSGTSPPTPISISNGGTGAATAPTALTNLGALPLAGGTMTGSLIINANAAALPAGPTAQNLLRLGGTDGQYPCAVIDGFGSVGSVLALRTSGGTAAAPTASVNGAFFGSVQGNGRGTTSYGLGAQVSFYATEAWTDTAHGSQITFDTCATGASTTLTRASIGRGLLIRDASGTVPAGGDLGPGTLNAAGNIQSGGTIIVSTPSDSTLALNKAAGANQAFVYGQRAGATRWTIVLGDNTTETGANSGSDFAIGAWTDAGAFRAIPLQINRATGQTVMAAGGATPLFLRNPGSDCFMRQDGSHSWSFGPQGATGDYWLYDNTRAALTIGVAASNGGCVNTTGTWTALSDISLKQDVQPYTRGLDAVLQLNPVTFRYKPATPFAPRDEPSQILFGLVAQDVEPYIPEIVGSMIATVGEEQCEVATLNGGDLIYALINSVKTLKAELDELRAALPPGIQPLPAPEEPQ